ncbi:4-hydroxy-3-methylbut-2-en-1-yl diphosphate synthase [candidate division WOR-3 bacterium]|mgnify:CR=1 FL=1|uniref:4-hydroxy-3-methylbut-2-en-1-yl diphosphate synthase n=1 Tax=candidate division WOR-3 bacterium TaxID=2052148 RepID=A0A660SJE8_UNCW3|nr:MAG: 4-hydroxy-3-methylbut-2-en-1-yl diphosphate synthase [candidate division WOR-3 bacterium]
MIVDVGGVKIGAGVVVVQSMIKRPIDEVDRIIEDIKRLKRAGCELIRVSVPNKPSLPYFKKIVRGSVLPVIADIHFHADLALAAIDAGAAKIRINPGNIKKGGLKRIARVARRGRIPIRIGVNAGSIDRRRFATPTPEALLTTVREAVDIFAGVPLVLSAKSSDIPLTLEVYRRMKIFGFPLHIGITEAGPPFRGGIRSGVGLGILLAEGIGDTIRVSLTGDPVMEVVAAYEILNSLDLRRHGPILISCPTCSRCRVDLLRIVNKVEERISDLSLPIKIALMGCEVNGPGEARDADIGIAFGRGTGLLFKKGRVVRKVSADEAIEVLFNHLREGGEE